MAGQTLYEGVPFPAGLREAVKQDESRAGASRDVVMAEASHGGAVMADVNVGVNWHEWMSLSPWAGVWDGSANGRGGCEW
ncbi:hypothetical protein GCM10010469_34950 [Streptomyces labedae]|uniref:Uncharacterized protein n=2 Tax=Streptomyces TaxID=1883 RepID=A0ABQ2U187_9ACTN|nr:hypothetical protein GCM10010265_59010 [Streptomyces griseoincarnatus]GGT58789.1 hypothetical protein GCM10010287_36190 [Streptomyces variabilis]